MGWFLFISFGRQSLFYMLYVLCRCVDPSTDLNLRLGLGLGLGLGPTNPVNCLTLDVFRHSYTVHLAFSKTIQSLKRKQ
jgi:hypothetical protein